VHYLLALVVFLQINTVSHPFNFPNLIFDLGGVVLDIDYDRVAEAFQKLGLLDFDEIYSRKKQDHFFDDFEKGMMDDETFRKTINTFFNHPVPDVKIDEAWNSMLLEIPNERYHWLKSLKRSHRLFLLSNTNHIHVAAFTRIIIKKYGKNILEELFEKIYFSCELKMRKPDAEIFEKVVSENNLIPSQTLFIDDSVQHIEGAKKYGLNVLLLDKGKKLEDFEIEG
jgi:glucose-1-phosphatase